MKKSLLLVLSAALLFVGCTKELEQKVEDLTARVDAVEIQVAANKAAIEALQACKFVSSYAETSTGWILTLNTGEKLAIYNGTNGKDGANGAAGKDGDAFFQSVVVEGEAITFTLADGTKFTVPYVVEFELLLLTDGAVVNPGTSAEIPFLVNGATDATKVYAIACGSFTAKVDTEKEAIIITVPEGVEVTDNTVVLCADRGDGKTSIKAITLEGAKVETPVVSGEPSAWKGFWEAGSGTIAVASNVPVTVASDAEWLKVTQTKGMVEHEWKFSWSQSPCGYSRTGHVTVVDPLGTVLQTVTVQQTGTKPFMVGNFGYDNWDAAVAGIKANFKKETGGHKPGTGGSGINADGTVCIAVSEGTVYGTFNIPGDLDSLNTPELTLKYKFLPRSGADGSKCIIVNGIVVNGAEVTVQDINVKCYHYTKANGTTIPTTNFGKDYPFGILVTPKQTQPVTLSNVKFTFYSEKFSTNSGTVLVDEGSTAKWTIDGCNLDAIGTRFGQFYGGDVTIKNSRIENAYASYAIRMYLASNLTLQNNMFNTPVIANLRTGENAFTGKATLGDGTKDNNSYGTKVTDIFTGAQSVKPAENNGPVILDGVRMAGVWDAINKAGVGSVIEIEKGTYDINGKIKNGASMTIKAAEGCSADDVVLCGNFEIAGSVTIEGVTIQSKKGVTNNVLTCNITGDNYVWGHNYLVRIENGAKDVTIKNCKILATAEDTGLASSMSTLWISQATNVQFIGNYIETAEKAAYCCNQTHLADVLFKDNTFVGGGDNKWAIRAMDTDVITLDGNMFKAVESAVAIYSDFKGTLTYGDGTEDNNAYRGVTNAIQSNLTKKQVIFDNGATINPFNVKFNEATTGGPIVYKLTPKWQHIDDIAWLNEFGIGANGKDTEPRFRDCRFMAMNETGMYTVTGERCATDNRDKWAYRLSLEDGKIVAKDTLTDPVNTGLFWMSGVTSTDDGTILVSNMVNKAAGPLKVFKLDENCKLTKVLEVSVAHKDGNPRVGDIICTSGTMQDGYLYAPDYQYASCRVFRFALKDGQIDTTWQNWYFAGGTAALAKPSNFSSVERYKQGEYVYTVDGARQPMYAYLNEGILIGNIKSSLNLADCAATSWYRSPKFFTKDGQDYFAILEMTGVVGGSDSYGATVRIYALPTQNIAADLTGATAVATYSFTSTRPAGNGLGAIDVLQKDGKTYIGVHIRNSGAALLEFE